MSKVGANEGRERHRGVLTVRYMMNTTPEDSGAVSLRVESDGRVMFDIELSLVEFALAVMRSQGNMPVVIRWPDDTQKGVTE